MHIVFYGPEGSGKGTQAKLLAEKLGLPILTSGDLVRETAATDKGMIGDVCRDILITGKYVPDSEMFVLWKRRLKRPDARKNWIMDGFPRNIEQAKFLDDKIDKYGYKVERVFYLHLSEEESYKRLFKRARPLHPGSSELHDSPERIKSRLALYKESEKSVLEFYRQKGVLIEVNADQSVEDVHKAIMAHVS
ncbi:MAG: nucleoside monophosphate kinase [Patescibacteria group bacterium]